MSELENQNKKFIGNLKIFALIFSFNIPMEHFICVVYGRTGRFFGVELFFLSSEKFVIFCANFDVLQSHFTLLSPYSDDLEKFFPVGMAGNDFREIRKC